MKNIGICFGGYCPLHRGHLDLIMRAKKENDITFVIVCGYNNEPRANEIDLPLNKRYTIIKNFLEDDLVKVYKINDTEIGLDESMSPNNWAIWTGVVGTIVWDSLDNGSQINWYVAEPSYKEGIINNVRWMRYCHNVIVADKVFDISATKIRSNPLKYWDMIALPFRPYLCHNILITGTASEGKTTLTKDIGKYFGLPYSYEKGRDICKLKEEPEFTCKDYIYNIYEQRKLNEELICNPWNPGIMVSDTDNMVTLMYARGHAGKPGFVLSEEDYDTLFKLAKAYAPTTKWNKIFLIKPREKDIVDDGERYMPDSDYTIRKGYYQSLKNLYDEFGYEYEELDGTYYENFCRVRDYIKEIKYED